MIGRDWPGARGLVTDERAPQLDLSAAVGQMQYTFRFELVDAVSGLRLGDIHPIRGAALSHDSAGTIKRRLTLPLGVTDTSEINALTDRVSPFMVIPGAPCPDTTHGDWPLGRYMFAAETLRVGTGGTLASAQLFDEMFLVDQEMPIGVNGMGQAVDRVIFVLLDGLPVRVRTEPSPYTSADAWGIGTTRGQACEALATAGDYWSPWFDNTGEMRWIRTFNPAMRVPDLDFDIGYRIDRDSIVKTNGLLTAPNTIVVISNAPQNSTEPCVGTATLPPSSPLSVAQRGFQIVRRFDLQLSDPLQASAVAQGLMERQSVFELMSLQTSADPRFDGYNVVRFEGANWLSLAWDMPLIAGAPMSHTLRRAYS